MTPYDSLLLSKLDENSKHKKIINNEIQIDSIKDKSYYKIKLTCSLPYKLF